MIVGFGYIIVWFAMLEARFGASGKVCSGDYLHKKSGEEYSDEEDKIYEVRCGVFLLILNIIHIITLTCMAGFGFVGVPCYQLGLK